MREKKRKTCTVWEKLLEEGLFADEKEAETWVMMKKVLVNDQPVWSLHEKVPAEGLVRIKEFYKKQYVNKGGFKLEAALESFGIHAAGKVVLDCGASTGGFTDCWLQHGAGRVYAVDAGFGQLAGKLAADARVVNLERTNLSDEKLKDLNPKPEMVSLDLSYLSLKKALPVCREILKESGLMICLVKPIYEVDSAEIRRSGNINQRGVLGEVLRDLCGFYRESGLDILGLTNSPIRGNGGTLEYLVAVCWNYKDIVEADNINLTYEEEIEKALDASLKLAEYKKQ